MAWDMTDFRNILDKYEKMYKEEKDPIIRYELAKNIAGIKKEIVSEELYVFEKRRKDKQERERTKQSSLNRLISRFKSKEPISFNINSSYGSIVADIYDVSLYKEIYPYLEDFHSQVKYLVDFSKRGHGPKSQLKLTDEEILDLMHDLFKSTNKKIFDAYSVLEKNRDKSININHDKSSNYGAHFWFEFVDDRFIEVGTKGDMELTLPVLAHEIGHFIGSLANEPRYVSEGSYCEVESIFFELVAYDYFAKTISHDYYINAMSGEFEAYSNDINGILITKNITDEFFDNFTKVKDPYAYHSCLVNSSCGFSHKDINYAFSFLAALELFEIYQEDKDLAIDLLYKIMEEDKTKSEVSKITDNIDLNSHLDTHVKRLHISRGGLYGMVQ